MSLQHFSSAVHFWQLIFPKQVKFPFFSPFFAFSSSACWSNWDWSLGVVSRGSEGLRNSSFPFPATITHKSMHKRTVLALCTPAACPGMDKPPISAQTHHLQLHHSRNGDFRALCLPLTAWKNSSWLPALTHKHTHSVLAASSELLTHWNIPVSSK